MTEPQQETQIQAWKVLPAALKSPKYESSSPVYPTGSYLFSIIFLPEAFITFNSGPPSTWVEYPLPKMLGQKLLQVPEYHRCGVLKVSLDLMMQSKRTSFCEANANMFGWTNKRWGPGWGCMIV